MKKLEINKQDLKNNLNIIKEILKKDNPKTKIIGVVKANGMGLDLVQYSSFLIENEINILAVANLEEALILRKEKISQEILMLTPCTEEEELEKLIQNNITITIGNIYEYELLEKKLNNLEKSNVKIHIKIDTGFGRYGFLYNDIESISKVFNKNEKIIITGIFTHFSNPINEKWTRLQFNRFNEVIENLKNLDLYSDKIIRHCSASTAFLKYPDMRLDGVRLGSIIQGRTLIKKENLKKIGNFKTKIIEIKSLPKGYNISYGNTYKTKKETKIAIIPVGYVDGLNRNKLRDDFSLKNNIISVLMELKKIFKNNNLKVKIDGEYYPIIGRLGMYHSIIDITNSNNINIGTIVEIDITPLQTNDIIRREYI